VLFPALYRRLAAFGQRVLSPRSRLRRAWLCRANTSGWAAFSRRDFKLMLILYASDVEFEFPPDQQTLGLSGTFRGHKAMAEALGELRAGWDSLEIEPVFLIDLGERILALGIFHVRGHASGVELDQEFAQLVALKDGLTVRDQAWFRWEEGLGAVGLDRDSIALHSRGKAGQAASSAR
jgi:ketosteroid isomerase-like protein